MAISSFIIADDPLTPPPGLQGAVYAIGNFDGVHRGHRAVIARAQELAARQSAPCAVLTFEPHPADFFAGKSVVFRLTNPIEKASACRALGLAGIVTFRFTPAFAQLSAEDFVAKILVKRLQIAGLAAGYDFHFGARRSGSPAFLKEAGARFGFPVEIVARVSHDKEGALDPVSSSATRLALEKGDVRTAAQFLGRPWSMSGRVIAGRKLGRELGFPTANIAVDPSCRLRWGVYAVRLRIDGKLYGGAASIGVRPSVDNGPPLLEVYIFDFSGDLYGRTLCVEFVAFLRPEEKFDSLDDLKTQILRDVQDARQALTESIFHSG